MNKTDLLQFWVNVLNKKLFFDQQLFINTFEP